MRRSPRTLLAEESALYYVTAEVDERRLSDALTGGVDAVQLRIKEPVSDAAILEHAGRITRMINRYETLFVLNDRPDLVEAADADGVHVGQDDMPVAEARAIVGDERVIGLSTHTPAQIDAAQASGADYIGVGPVFATPTKPGRPAVGLELVEYAAAHSTLPWFAIGGIDTTNVEAVVAAGADRIAVVRAIGAAADPRMAACELKSTVSPIELLGRA